MTKPQVVQVFLSLGSSFDCCLYSKDGVAVAVAAPAIVVASHLPVAILRPISVEAFIALGPQQLIAVAAYYVWECLSSCVCLLLQCWCWCCSAAGATTAVCGCGAAVVVKKEAANTAAAV